MKRSRRLGKIWLSKRIASQISRLPSPLLINQHQRQAKLSRFISRAEDFVLGQRHIRLLIPPSLHLNKNQRFRIRIFRFDVIANAARCRHIARHPAKLSFCLHHRLHCPAVQLHLGCRYPLEILPQSDRPSDLPAILWERPVLPP